MHDEFEGLVRFIRNVWLHLSERPRWWNERAREDAGRAVADFIAPEDAEKLWVSRRDDPNCFAAGLLIALSRELFPDFCGDVAKTLRLGKDWLRQRVAASP